MLSIRAVGDVGWQENVYQYVNTGISIGDTIEVSGVMSTTKAAGHVAGIQVNIQGAPSPLTTVTRQSSETVANGTFCERFVIPAGMSGGLLIYLQVGPSAGTAVYKRLRVRTLTTLGLA